MLRGWFLGSSLVWTEESTLKRSQILHMMHWPLSCSLCQTVFMLFAKSLRFPVPRKMKHRPDLLSLSYTALRISHQLSHPCPEKPLSSDTPQCGAWSVSRTRGRETESSASMSMEITGWALTLLYPCTAKMGEPCIKEVVLVCKIYQPLIK